MAIKSPFKINRAFLLLSAIVMLAYGWQTQKTQDVLVEAVTRQPAVATAAPVGTRNVPPLQQNPTQHPLPTTVAIPRLRTVSEDDLAKFQSVSVEIWQINRDLEQKLVRTLSGGKWRPLRSHPADAAQEFLDQYGEKFFGVSSDNLHLAQVVHEDRDKVIFKERINGYPVYGADIVMFFQDGLLTRVQNNLLAVTGSEILRLKINDQVSAQIAADPSHGELVLVPASQNVLRLAYQYYVTVKEPETHSYEILMDTERASVISKRDRVIVQ